MGYIKSGTFGSYLWLVNVGGLIAVAGHDGEHVQRHAECELATLPPFTFHSATSIIRLLTCTYVILSNRCIY